MTGQDVLVLMPCHIMARGYDTRHRVTKVLPLSHFGSLSDLFGPCGFPSGQFENGRKFQLRLGQHSGRRSIGRSRDDRIGSIDSIDSIKHDEKLFFSSGNAPNGGSQSWEEFRSNVRLLYYREMQQCIETLESHGKAYETVHPKKL